MENFASTKVSGTQSFSALSAWNEEKKIGRGKRLGCEKQGECVDGEKIGEEAERGGGEGVRAAWTS
eukprot:746239-Hanusia_phi.AAC.12